MKQVTLNLPDNIDLDETQISMLLAAQLYDMEKLSLGQAAQLVGLTKREFMDQLGKYDVSVFGETLDDIDRFLQKNA